jgi:endonuclease/exonuclease/phosphatase family metal-dependent hydrolase
MPSKHGPMTMDISRSVNDGRIRVATLNLFGLRENWVERRDVMRTGFAALQPDVVFLQEVVKTADYDQVHDVFDKGYEVIHHSARLEDGQGDSIASRWPIIAVHEVDVPAGEGEAGILSSALAIEVEVPAPVGRIVVANHPASFPLTYEAEREQQAVAVADFLERLVAAEPAHVIVAGDLNASPEAASIRFWTGKQSLDGVSVCYRDAWAAQHASDPGHTFTPNNTLTTTAEDGQWELELGRRIDYILVRCTEHGPTLDVRACHRFLDKPVDGVWASDHFGVTADLSALTPTGRPAP